MASPPPDNVCGVSATYGPRSGATPATARLRVDVLDRAAKEHGAKNVTEQATFLAVSRSTLSRYRSNQMTPSLATALSMSKALHVSVHELFELVTS